MPMYRVMLCLGTVEAVDSQDAADRVGASVSSPHWTGEGVEVVDLETGASQPAYAPGIATLLGLRDRLCAPAAGYIEDNFVIEGRGTAVSVVMTSGTLRVSDRIRAVITGRDHVCTVVGISRGRELADDAIYGEEVGLLLRGEDLDAWQKGVAFVAE